MSYPHWLGLLKWSLGHSDGTADSDFSEMSDENKEFLEKVMAEMVKDEPKRMAEILETFSKLLDRGVSASDENEIEGMLDEVHDIIDQIDMADIFVRFGGIKALLGFLDASELSDELKKTSCVILGELAQNNPPVQESFFVHGVIDAVCVTATTHTNPAVCAKALYAISCTIRGFEKGEQRFCSDLHGHMLLLRLLERNEDLCSRRAYFLATALISSDYTTPQRITAFAEKLVPSSVTALYAEDTDIRDNALCFLSAVALSRQGRDVLRQVCGSADDHSLPLLDEALATRKEVVSAAAANEKEKADECGEDPATSALYAKETATEEVRRIVTLMTSLRSGYNDDLQQPLTSSDQDQLTPPQEEIVFMIGS